MRPCEKHDGTWLRISIQAYEAGTANRRGTDLVSELQTTCPVLRMPRCSLICNLVGLLQDSCLRNKVKAARSRVIPCISYLGPLMKMMRSPTLTNFTSTNQRKTLTFGPTSNRAYLKYRSKHQRNEAMRQPGDKAIRQKVDRTLHVNAITRAPKRALKVHLSSENHLFPAFNLDGTGNMSRIDRLQISG
jgi:hypothetical protein